MCKILISINPEHVEKIIAGIKRYEFRTKVAKRDIDAIIIYCTYPTKKVLAEVKIKSMPRCLAFNKYAFVSSIGYSFNPI